MKLSSGLLSALAFNTVPLLAHPLDLPFGPDIQNGVEKRQSNIVFTVGPRAAGIDNISTRLEISDLATDYNAYSLFILAMQQFQAQAQTDSTSFYQIAGIHGAPLADYNNVAPCPTCPTDVGYCTHASVLFPSWHRVYVALFEQQMLVLAANIASTYPAAQQATMQAAATNLRLPFWDWAATPPQGEADLPSEISSPQVTVNGPNGNETIANPLYQHHFSDPSQLAEAPFTTWPNTLRHPTSAAQNAVSNEPDTVTTMNNQRSSLQQSVFQMLTACNDYLGFSNTASVAGDPSCGSSLEAVHNNVHGDVGGSSTAQGHMSDPIAAAFDPVFWLHHCNVDRLFALWQSQHPTTYGASQTAVEPTWTIPSGSTQGLNSDLTPFYKSTGSFWTTADVQQWDTTFGYTYPEFSESDGSQGTIASIIQDLYAPGATAPAGTLKQKRADSLKAYDTSSNWNATSTSSTWAGSSTSSSGWTSTSTATTAYGPGWSATASIPSASPTCTSPGQSIEQYVANIKTPAFALDGPYSVYIFKGAPACEDLSTWQQDTALIGSFFTFSMANMTGDVLIRGSVPLNDALSCDLNDGGLEDWTEESIVQWIKDNLQVRIGGAGGTAQPCELKGLDIEVFHSTLTLCEDKHILPTWSEFKSVYQVLDCGSAPSAPAPTSTTAMTASSSSTSSSSWSASSSSSATW